MTTSSDRPDRARSADDAGQDPRIIAGRYRVIERLGQGATAAVFRADDFETEREVAVKVLLPKRLKQATRKERFLIEARAAFRIQHPNVVEVIDWGETTAGQPYIAMEYVQGESLKRYVRRRHVIPWLDAAPILLQICAAMGAAHEVDVIHRDLKPDNIVLVPQPNPQSASGGSAVRQLPLVKVLDFGLAKLLEGPDARKLTQTGIVVGTPAFVAPEQIQGVSVDRRTDVYALGTIMYRMLCGAMPFSAANAIDLMRRHLSEPPQPPRKVNPLAPIPDGAGEIALKALAKSPDERYQTMEEMARAVAAVRR